MAKRKGSDVALFAGLEANEGEWQSNHLRLTICVFAALVSFLLIVTGCSSDPYENYGPCEIRGSVKRIEDKAAICTGKSSQLKYYVSGKYLNDFLLLSRISLSKSSFDISNLDTAYIDAGITSREFIEFLTTKNSNFYLSDLSNFASGDARWDPLIESRARLDSAESTRDSLLQEQFRLTGELSRGKATREEVLAAQQKTREFVDGEYSRIQNNYEAKLEVLHSFLVSHYGPIDENTLILALYKSTYPERIKDR